MNASVAHQGVPVIEVSPRTLFDSPRNYNASIIEFEGRRLMAYRSHRLDQGGRCGIAICNLNAAWEGSDNQWLHLSRRKGVEHHEDPRLFIFRGKLHVAYVESEFHAPAPYTCVIKYARLGQFDDGVWFVDAEFHPRYGRNDGRSYEKNWSFFDHDGELRAIYSGNPHTILAIDDEAVTKVCDAESAHWPWGEIRGGTPPIRLDDGQYLTVFHSSTHYPVEPHWRRYYAGAYTFDAKTFAVTAISTEPILLGSSEDGHATDPRGISSWKPFVVFPGGIIPHDMGYYVSFGVNDYKTVVADYFTLNLKPAGERWPSTYWRTENGTRPFKLDINQTRPLYLHWKQLGGSHGSTSAGVLEVTDPMHAMHLREHKFQEITREEYMAMASTSGRNGATVTRF